MHAMVGPSKLMEDIPMDAIQTTEYARALLSARGNKAMAEAIDRPSSSAYCLHAATAPFREAVAGWCERRFGVSVDPHREVQLLVGSQEGTAQDTRS